MYNTFKLHFKVITKHLINNNYTVGISILHKRNKIIISLGMIIKLLNLLFINLSFIK